MTYQSTTTLARIRAARPCAGGWRKLLAYLGENAADDDPLGLMTVLNSNGLDDALWVLSYAMPDDRFARHFQAWCAEQVLHLFEAERPDDSRVRNQIAMLRNDDATPKDRAAASAAAANAARDTARAAARHAASAAASADAAARHAAVAAACDAATATSAEWDTAWAAACDAATAAQEKQLRAMLKGNA